MGEGYVPDGARTGAHPMAHQFDQWINRVAGVTAHSMRLGLWCEYLAKKPVSQAAMLLEYLVGRARVDVNALTAYLPLADYPRLLEDIGGARFSEILQAARDQDLGGALLFLEHPGQRNVPETMGPPPDPLLEKLTLGHRKEAARGGRTALLDRLLKDPDPRVVRETLRNPRLREEEVVAIASRRPCPESVFWNLASSHAWIRRPPVQRSIVFNPYAPPRLSVTLLICLPDHDLKTALDQKRLHPAVHDGAREILNWGAEGEGAGG